MTLQECYHNMGGNYDEVMGRLRSERLVQKFVLKFLDDENYRLLCDSMETGDWDEAFRAAHTLKGMCQNLSFAGLGASADALTESLRREDLSNAKMLLEQVKEEYGKAENAIKTFQLSL